MENDNIIINKVAQSALVTIDLADFFPEGATATFDLKDHLFMELILKEKDYREALKNLDWSIYDGKNVGITCTADAIIPVWAFMLAASQLYGHAKEIIFGDEDTVMQTLFLKNIQKIDPAEFQDKRIVIKGCGEKKIPDVAYVEITTILRGVAKSIMYGEPCSTVPVYKQAKGPIS